MEVKFPKWIGDPSFLPPLGKLPSLKKLYIKGMDEVKIVGVEFFGTGPAFPSLESLSFEDMKGWKVWPTNVGVVVVEFPCLQRLILENCPNLVEVSLEALPCLHDLTLNHCPILVKVSLKPIPLLRILKLFHCGGGVLRSMVHVASSVIMLSISGIEGLSDEVWRGVMKYLGAVEAIIIKECDDIHYLWESQLEASKSLVKLRKLKVVGCENLVSSGEKEEEEEEDSQSNRVTSLRRFELRDCRNLERCNCPNTIKELKIVHCTIKSVSFPTGRPNKLVSIKSVSFPTGGPNKLVSIEIEHCNLALEKLLNNASMPMLEDISISYSPNLKSVIHLTCFIHVSNLIILGCESIDSFPAQDLSNFFSLKHLLIRNCPPMHVASFAI